MQSVQERLLFILMSSVVISADSNSTPVERTVSRRTFARTSKKEDEFDVEDLNEAIEFVPHNHRGDTNIKKLRHSWNFYFDDATKRGLSEEDYLRSLHSIGSFRTMPDFWNTWNEMKGLFEEVINTETNFRIFRTGIKPTWDDPANVNGGKWIVQAKKRKSKTTEPVDPWVEWLLLVQAIISGDLGADFICGAVFSFRPRGSVLSVWVSATARNPKYHEAMCSKLKTLFQTKHVRYQSHRMTKAQAVSRETKSDTVAQLVEPKSVSRLPIFQKIQSSNGRQKRVSVTPPPSMPAEVVEPVVSEPALILVPEEWLSIPASTSMESLESFGSLESEESLGSIEEEPIELKEEIPVEEVEVVEVVEPEVSKVESASTSDNEIVEASDESSSEEEPVIPAGCDVVPEPEKVTAGQQKEKSNKKRKNKKKKSQKKAAAPAVVCAQIAPVREVVEVVPECAAGGVKSQSLWNVRNISAIAFSAASVASVAIYYLL